MGHVEIARCDYRLFAVQGCKIAGEFFIPGLAFCQAAQAAGVGRIDLRKEEMIELQRDYAPSKSMVPGAPIFGNSTEGSRYFK